MRISRGRLYAFALPLLAPLRTAHGVIEARKGFMVEFVDDAGNAGYGEATPLPSFGGETLSTCEVVLRAALEECVGAASKVGSPRAVRSAAPSEHAAPVARCAIACAQLDLETRRRDLPLAAALASSTPARAVRVNALVASSDAETIAAEVERLAPCGCDTWKLKVGAASLDIDLDRVRALRSAIGPGAKIRLDANGAWSTSSALSAVTRFADSQIELIEQPLAPGDPLALGKLRRDSPIRIAADESIVDRVSLRALLAAEAVDAVALKLPVLGGARAVVELAKEAHEQGVEAYVTSFLDSSLGIAAALHVACALPGGGPAHGLATASLLARDLVAALPVQSGVLSLPTGPGLGLVPDRALLGEPIAEVRA